MLFNHFFTFTRTLVAITTVLVCTSLTVAAQTPGLVEEFKLLKAAQEKLNGDLEIQAEYLLYGTQSSSAPTERMEMTMRRQGINMYSKNGPIESLSNATYNLTLNHQDRYAVITRRIHTKSPTNAKNPTLDMALMLAKFEKYGKYKVADQPKSGERGLCFEPKVGEYEKIDYYYSTSTYLPTRAILYYRSASRNGVPETMKQPKVVLQYSKIDTKPVFAKNAFSEKQYFTENTAKKTFELLPAYAKYRFVNQETNGVAAAPQSTKKTKKR